MVTVKSIVIELVLKFVFLLILVLVLSRVVETHADSKELLRITSSTEEILKKNLPHEWTDSLPVVGLTENSKNSRTILSREIWVMTQAQYLTLGLMGMNVLLIATGIITLYKKVRERRNDG